MIVITKIETINVPDNDFYNIQNFNPDNYVRVNNMKDTVPARLIQESVRGRRFIRGSDGSEIIIGMSKVESWLVVKKYVNEAY